VERAGGRPVVQYRGEILPLVPVARVIRRRSRRRRPRAAVSRTLQVAVCTAEGRRVGLVVGRILDVVDEPIAARDRGTRPGVRFTAVVRDRVAEFLDIAAVVRGHKPGGEG
jgi:two-component system chemotaxis sensor kinase CheA